ncbi:MAG TPA: hypothetical protein VF188_14825 [Longimicrobiales bacterium]
MPAVDRATKAAVAAPPRSVRRRRARRVLYALSVLAFIGLAIWLPTIELEGALEAFVLRFGYAGYVVAACIAGINVVVPTTHLILTAPLLEAGLDPWILVACGAVGATLADGVGYIVGSSGRRAFASENSRTAERLTRIVEQHPRLAPVVLFLWAAFAPLPNEVLVIPAGVLGYGILRTGLITLGGNIVFNAMAVVLGRAIV